MARAEIREKSAWQGDGGGLHLIGYDFTSHLKGQVMADQGGGGFAGFLGFIAIIGLINLLSWMFDWPFWIY